MELWVDCPVSTYKVEFARGRDLMSNSDLHLHEHTFTHTSSSIHLPSQEPMHTCKKISGKENKKDFEVSSVIQREKENKTQSHVLKRNHLKFKFVTDCIPIPSTYVGNWISKFFYTIYSANLQKKCIGWITVYLGWVWYIYLSFFR